MPGRGRISPSAAGSPRPALGGPSAKEMAVGAPVVSSGLTVGGAVRRVAYSADITGVVERGLGSSFLPTRHLRADGGDHPMPRSKKMVELLMAGYVAIASKLRASVSVEKTRSEGNYQKPRVLTTMSCSISSFYCRQPIRSNNR